MAAPEAEIEDASDSADGLVSDNKEPPCRNGNGAALGRKCRSAARPSGGQRPTALAVCVPKPKDFSHTGGTPPHMETWRDKKYRSSSALLRVAVVPLLSLLGRLNWHAIAATFLDDARRQWRTASANAYVRVAWRGAAR